MNHDNCTSPINQSFNCFISSSRESGRSTWNETAQRCHPVASHKFLLKIESDLSRLFTKKNRAPASSVLFLSKGRVGAVEKRDSDVHDDVGHGM